MDLQLKIGEIDISQIKFNEKSRDEMVKILKGLQHIYIDQEVRSALFDYLENLIPKETSKNTGRPGVDLWKIFVLGIVRLGKNCNLDGLLDLANNHIKVREMMGHMVEDRESYDMETLRRNMSLFTPEILDDINKVIVDAGHKIVVKKTKKCR